ncbi:MAG TPA: hypothetical protein VI197_17490 [Polyangiaceae bacterium]
MLRFLLLPAVLLAASGCGKQQAADPRAVLGKEMQHGGVDGRTGEPVVASPAHGDRDLDAPASPEECSEAAGHLVQFGIEASIREETDPAMKQKLEAELARGEDSQVLKDLRDRWTKEWTQECLDRGDSKGEVDCILKATREADLERCAPSD